MLEERFIYLLFCQGLKSYLISFRFIVVFYQDSDSILPVF